MGAIDWEAFMQRVPPGTKVSSVNGEVFDITDEWKEVPYFGGGRCGILLSFEIESPFYMPDYFTGEPDQESAFKPHMVVQPFDFIETVEFYDPTDLEYLLKGEWLTFEQVMA
jgi:hypothetical protein